MLGDFEFQNSWVFLVVGLIMIFGVLTTWRIRGERKRKKLFISRTALSEMEWFESFCKCSNNARILIRRVLEAIAFDIEIKWTQLRPSDTFKYELRVGKQYAAYDDLDLAEQRVLQIAKEYRIPSSSLPGFIGSLDVFLQKLQELADQSEKTP